MNEALFRIGLFTADHGGTEIETPMIVAQTLDSALTAEEATIDFKKRMFILTDGSVSNADGIINLAREMSQMLRIFTIGLGSGCDRRLCEGTAEAGRGTCSIVEDKSKDLNGQVVKALQHATQHSLKACSLAW